VLFPLVGSVAALVALTGAAVPVTDVEIAIAASPPAASVAVREDLEDLLSRRGLAARYRQLERVTRDEVLRPAAEAPCALACIWLDLGVTNPARAFVYVSPTAAPEVLIRSLPLPGGVDEVAREEVAHIVATSVEALREGRPLPPPTNAADLPLAKTVREPAPPCVSASAPASSCARPRRRRSAARWACPWIRRASRPAGSCAPPRASRSACSSRSASSSPRPAMRASSATATRWSATA
jgi:hypothetical protein